MERLTPPVGKIVLWLVVNDPAAILQPKKINAPCLPSHEFPPAIGFSTFFIVSDTVGVEMP